MYNSVIIFLLKIIKAHIFYIVLPVFWIKQISTIVLCFSANP
jgi:hypothetical protein